MAEIVETPLETISPNLGLPLLLPPPRPRAPLPHIASPSPAEKLTNSSQLPLPLRTRLLGGGPRSHGGGPEHSEDEEGDVYRICSDDEHPLRYPCASIKLCTSTASFRQCEVLTGVGFSLYKPGFQFCSIRWLICPASVFLEE
ncbi:uncharacterized protein [Triticum aestivum]|uniref:uncharacterized protein n=1 Tax=Triticum aestivum TaxID=4565 RepID=UPI001D008A50|nr:uncharacterized protein LOC123071065 [Triticum aestivum]